jgi:hypothetical protein
LYYIVLYYIREQLHNGTVIKWRHAGCVAKDIESHPTCFECSKTWLCEPQNLANPHHFGTVGRKSKFCIVTIYVCVCVCVLIESEGWGGVSFNNATTYVALVTNECNINKEHWWKDPDKGKEKCSETNFSVCCVLKKKIQHKLARNLTWTGNRQLAQPSLRV